ncbi:MAG TPA: hypothetical protein VHP99_00400, partial [Pyrinomonadaceae bacterium]|nr:hypothetical protein [Pyrinomonadaceae bacterium]
MNKLAAQHSTERKFTIRTASVFDSADLWRAGHVKSLPRTFNVGFLLVISAQNLYAKTKGAKTKAAKP